MTLTYLQHKNHFIIRTNRPKRSTNVCPRNPIHSIHISRGVSILTPTTRYSTVTKLTNPQTFQHVLKREMIRVPSRICPLIPRTRLLESTHRGASEYRIISWKHLRKSTQDRLTNYLLTCE